ncbi:Rho GTPase activation protein [Cristinia sonorae]|uniref:Rho GTPase activation protein n=1 Tax=Cristinia sonorae TaxID=1940300 RepID=A0A8K0UUB1_9AGAR|nr:Rho GTPase activation protein [Cristinia sonorae]
MTATHLPHHYPRYSRDVPREAPRVSAKSRFARQYFLTHRTGFVFERKVLCNNKLLQKEAIKVFRSIQRIMGDRAGPPPSGPSLHNGSMAILHSTTNSVLLEEERWLLGVGLVESVFKGWQLLCVLLVTFPPSKNFEGSLQSYIQQATSQQEGSVDVMAKYCLRRLDNIGRKGPRGKAPTLAEIETASDASIPPPIFGELLDVIYRQQRNHPHQKASSAVCELNFDKGYYTLDGFDDPTILASCLKLWLRELCDPLVPEELYNDCIEHAQEPETCVQIVQRLPTINQRVVVFVVSFLQLFLEEQVMSMTKMTSANLALVMALNLLRCNSDSIAVVFTNAAYEQTFVHNLLLHLKCSEVDPDYVPTHGHGAVPPPDSSQLRKSKSRQRANY